MADLAPLLRSKLLARVLELVLLEKGPWTAEQLAARTGAAYPTVTKEVRRLEQAGVIVVTTVGRKKLLAPDGSDPTVRALGRLLRASDRLPDGAGGGDVAKKKDRDKKGKKKK